MISSILDENHQVRDVLLQTFYFFQLIFLKWEKKFKAHQVYLRPVLPSGCRVVNHQCLEKLTHHIDWTIQVQRWHFLLQVVLANPHPDIYYILKFHKNWVFISLTRINMRSICINWSLIILTFNGSWRFSADLMFDEKLLAVCSKASIDFDKYSKVTLWDSNNCKLEI